MDRGSVGFRPTYSYNEFKYVVPPRCLGVARQLLHIQMGEPDPFPEGDVQSVYYDTLDRSSLGQCKNGQRRKIKFRIRRYDDQEAAQLQVKLKDGFAVAKLKQGIAFSHPPPALWPTQEGLAEGAEIRALALAAATLRPVIDIRYHRERFRFHDYRVTLDSRIEASPAAGLVYPRLGGAEVEFAVLEVKTAAETPTLPPGLRELVSFSALSKYGILMRMLLGEVDVLCKSEPW